MDIDQIILYAMAFGAALGGLDQILGNRLGLGRAFENGFQLLGPVALSMAGIICLAPLLSAGLGTVVDPVCRVLNIDPGVFGGILAIDMGGYPLSLELAREEAMGRFSGILVAAVFGCTVVFTIPVGLSTMGPEDRGDFTQGILLGFLAIPAALVAGGLTMGLGLGRILWNSLPILLICLVLAVGILGFPEKMSRGFQRFASFIQALSTLGLTLAAVNYLTGKTWIPGMPPLMEAMETVCGICIVMLGSMPLAELIQQLLKKPLARIQAKTGLNGAATTGLMLGLISATPALAMIPQMDRRGKVFCSAAFVCAIGVFGAHLAFTMNAQPGMVNALLAAKLTGGILGGGIALFATRKMGKGIDKDMLS